MTAKTLQAAMSRAVALPEAVQEQIGHELLTRIDALEALRAKVAVGAAELDAGLGGELDVGDVIREARRKHVER